SDTTVEAVTIAHSDQWGIYVEAQAGAALAGTRIYNVTFDDDSGPALRIVPAGDDVVNGPFADDGVVACSHFVDTPNGADHCTSPATLGISADAIRGWTIRNNTFQNMICGGDYKRTIWIRFGSRDVTIASNTIIGSNLNIMVGED